MASFRLIKDDRSGAYWVTAVRQNRAGGLDTVGSVKAEQTRESVREAVGVLANILADLRSQEKEAKARAYVQLRLHKEGK